MRVLGFCLSDSSGTVGAVPASSSRIIRSGLVLCDCSGGTFCWGLRHNAEARRIPERSEWSPAQPFVESEGDFLVRFSFILAGSNYLDLQKS